MLSQGVIDFCHVVWLSVTEELKRRCLNLIELGDWNRRRIISSSLKRFDSFVPTLSPSRVCPSMSSGSCRTAPFGEWSEWDERHRRVRAGLALTAREAASEWRNKRVSTG